MRYEYKDGVRVQVEYKTFPLEVKKFDEDDDYFYFKGYLSTFGNVDRGGDVVMKGAFLDSLEEHTPSLLWSHESDDPPLGVFTKLAEDNIGLDISAKMPKEDSFVRERIIPQMRVKSINSMSIGYSVMSMDDVEFQDDIRVLKKVFLWEGSLVTIPMNERAQIKSEGIVSVDDIDLMDARTLENLFHSGIKLSRSQSKRMVSLIKGSKNRDDSENSEEGQREVGRITAIDDGWIDDGWSDILRSIKTIKI